jgi:hypothetical protein
MRLSFLAMLKEKVEFATQIKKRSAHALLPQLIIHTTIGDHN